MIDNHYKFTRSTLYVEPEIGWARRLVAEHRGLAYVKWMREVVADRQKFTHERMVKEGANLLYATVEMFARELHDEYGGYSFHDFVTCGEAMQFASSIESLRSSVESIRDPKPKSGNITPEVVMTIKQVWHEAVLHLTGEHVYDVSSGLAEKLAHTELRGVSTDDLKLPFESIYVTVPKRAGLKVWNDDTGWHEIAGMYLVEDPPRPPNHGSLVEGGGKERCWRFLVWGRSKSEDAFDDALFHFVFYLPPGTTVSAQMEVEHARNSKAEVGVTAHPGETPEMLKFYREHWREIFQWAMNVAIYATWPDADVEHVIADPEARSLWERHTRAPKGSSKRVDLLKRFKAIHYPDRRVVLGRHVTVLDVEAEREHRPGKPLSVRTLVSGHWIRYAHGKGRTERRWHWREPFWRGPRDAPVSTPEHKVV